MSRKKSDESELPPEDQALVQRVDAMMQAERVTETPPATPAPKAEKPDANAAPKPLTSAPELPGDLLKTLQATAEKAVQSKATKKIAVTDNDPEQPTEVPVDVEPETESAAEPPSEPIPDSSLNSSENDKAVDDIVAKEGDLVLAVEDKKLARKQDTKKDNGWKDKLRRLLKNKWTWVGVVVLLMAVFALPLTRYKVLGLVIKKSVTITVIDSKTASPVSHAEVSLAGATAKTDADGRAKVKAGVGQRSLVIKKQYYRELQTTHFVGFKAADSPRIKIVATGRLVPVTVLNKISGKPVDGAEITVLNTKAKTNNKGEAHVALPVTAKAYKAKLSFKGYNPSQVDIVVTDKVDKANNFELTPTGRVYFLSNRSGTLDVIGANLDGTERKTILEGTGKEDKSTTSLLASRDWRYLVLKARRDTPTAALYLIDTSTNKVTQFDTANADFSLVGWYQHSFIYALTRNNVAYWQPGRTVVKSYDADHLQLNQLDQAQAEGNASAYAYQEFQNFYTLNGSVIYTTQWHTYTATAGNYDTTGKTDTIRTVQPTGQNKKDYQSWPANTVGSFQSKLSAPSGLYFAVYDSTANKTNYYQYANQGVTAANIDQSAFNQAHPNFLLSPAGNQALWSELRDGKNALFVGDGAAGNRKQIAGLSDYTPYGWFTESYGLVAKNASELYIVPTNGLAADRQPLKITDYYKPAQTYPDYGYGGL